MQEGSDILASYKGTTSIHPVLDFDKAAQLAVCFVWVKCVKVWMCHQLGLHNVTKGAI